MLLPLPSRRAAERTEMHVVMLRYTAATVSACMHVTLIDIEKGRDHVTARQPHRVRPSASRVFMPNIPLLGSIIHSRE